MLIKPRKALNKAFLKIRPDRNGIELFKSKLILLLDSSKANESEEFHKNLISDFLKNTYYSPNYFINTKGRNDLVIHTSSEAKSNVGVIIEAKSPTNKAEMISDKNLNNKALQELVLYFLRERITLKNLEIKHLVATNLNEWFLFDAQIFDKLFAQNKSFVKQFQDFEEGKLSGNTTDFFYREIAKPHITSIIDKIEYTYFDLATYDTILRNTDKEDDAKLIVLYKLLSPEHLLKLSFANDSNSLDKNFYNELLHLIGLTETKEGGKKLIQRPKVGERNSGSLLENAINQLDSLDKISRLPNPKQYGATYEERLFTVGLELCITWVNRILFIKLLEAQLISYHKGDRSYAFLHKEVLHDYDNLNALFFMVLAKKPEDRNDRVKEVFAKVPYLNSSLFEPTDLEHDTLFIAGLEDTIPLPFISGTVIKDGSGKKQKGEINALDYFFDFLDAYDFASEGSEEIQEDNKTLINASVLGLIFEKINGYKDGSFYTPSFITMYMCKETIRRAVVQKFKSAPNPTKAGENFSTIETFNDLYNSITDLQGANDIINSLKICDPAVGSGHFLVSALNEIISIKQDLGILLDRKGKRLKEYQMDIVNDELIITDDDGVPFTYNPKSTESQRVQETLFHEKQTIIENCLFGVDINPNSVKICRLRLWIELLKNAYYKESREKNIAYRELETLPNIDINIKCGNSLIARFGLDADLKKALKQSKWNIESYKLAVDTYRNAESKEQKKDMERLIADIKGNFRSEIGISDPKKLSLEKKKGELFNYTQQVGLFDRSKKEQTAWNKAVNTLACDVKKLETDIEEIKSNAIYENAFEWRFEFPEVLNDAGDFVGFDVVIGNPPYIRQEEFVDIKNHLIKNFETHNGSADLFVYFVELGVKNLKENGHFSFIIPNKWMRSGYGKQIRAFLKTYQITEIVNFGDLQVFEEATTYPCILSITKDKSKHMFYSSNIGSLSFADGLASYIEQNKNEINISQLNDEGWTLTNFIEQNLLLKIKDVGISLSQYTNGNIFYGIKTGFNEAFVIDEITRALLIKENPNSIDIIKPLFAGRDIRRFITPTSKKYLVFSNRGINIENYSAIYNHLKKFELQLKAKAGAAAWYELQASPKNIDRFTLPKIIYPDISLGSQFTIDKSGSFINDTAFSIPLHDNYLLGILNSRVVLFYQKKIASEIRGGYLRWKSIYVNNIPIPNITLDARQPFIEKVDQILTLKQADALADTSVLEREIDLMVYELYGLSAEEIAVVEGS
ncbi:Type II restriction/modification system, DNA methylase subunit YeeA [Flavobacterium segetis]|uniref:site-specific DNA-methyltransferase (adenine-specific) n=1 Tax=Flavobacterium segetis TaxID=271157 RepID=A0A1M5FHC5_9FLAO|nr:TaqI-like C-terminal specificity domain-containing protein [Flavobacterium segetis]SHF90888.1 Type II restriction/modification system, DNA methylase subunit YeeA [Flavobacterium segetis]